MFRTSLMLMEKIRISFIAGGNFADMTKSASFSKSLVQKTTDKATCSRLQVQLIIITNGSLVLVKSHFFIAFSEVSSFNFTILIIYGFHFSISRNVLVMHVFTFEVSLLGVGIENTGCLLGAPSKASKDWPEAKVVVLPTNALQIDGWLSTTKELLGTSVVTDILIPAGRICLGDIGVD